ncbi:MAG: antibiotic biosynthesis monooxygenase [Chloroflexi bacterium]|nr:antibiotic biosynthesis monooxygenase [Chloroflexota bacterium]
MAFVRVSVYRFRSGTVDEVIRKAADELYPMLKGELGFRSYEIVKTGAQEGVAINSWDSREEAEAALQKAFDWIRDNFGPMFESVDNHVGELAFSSRE